MSSNSDQKAPRDAQTDKNGLPLSKDQMLSSSFEQPLFQDKPVFRSVSVATQPPTLSRFGGCSAPSGPAVFDSPFSAKPVPVPLPVSSLPPPSAVLPIYAELPKLTKLYVNTMHPANFCFVESTNVSSIASSLQRTLLRRSITFSQKATDCCFRFKCSYAGPDDASPCVFYVNMFGSSGSKQGVLVEVARWEGSALSFEPVKSALLESALVDEVGQNTEAMDRMDLLSESRPPLAFSAAADEEAGAAGAELDLSDIASVLRKCSKMDDLEFAFSALSKMSTSPALAKAMLREPDVLLALSTRWSKQGEAAVKDEDVKHMFGRIDDLCMTSLRNITACIGAAELSAQMDADPEFFASLLERCMQELAKPPASNPDRAFLAACILDSVVEANKIYGKIAIQNGAMETLAQAKAYGLKSHFKLGKQAVQAMANLECLA